MKHMVQKQVIDPITHMVLVTQRWNKIFEDLQNLFHARELIIRKMCKDKWNGLTFDFKKLLDYHAKELGTIDGLGNDHKGM
jgi:hypothetical protein